MQGALSAAKLQCWAKMCVCVCVRWYGQDVSAADGSSILLLSATALVCLHLNHTLLLLLLSVCSTQQLQQCCIVSRHSDSPQPLADDARRPMVVMEAGHCTAAGAPSIVKVPPAHLQAAQQ
jgi:hypothetical protein